MVFIFTFLLFISSYSTTAQIIEKAYLTTDREVYGLNDTLWFKGYTFNIFNTLVDNSIAFHVAIYDNNGETIINSSWPVLNGISFGQLKLPEKEGKYYIRAFSGQMIGGPDDWVFEKEIIIRKEMPFSLLVTQHSMKIDTSSTVVLLRVTDPDYLNVPDITLKSELWQGDSLLSSSNITTDEQGIAKIPVQKSILENGDFRIITQQTNQEPASNNTTLIPIKVDKPKKLDIRFLPEGGHFLANHQNKIAFKAIDQRGRPVDISGELLNQDFEVIENIQSKYKGMGLFNLIGLNNHQYYLRVNNPEYADSLYQLPIPSQSGIVLTISEVRKKEAIVAIKASQDQMGKPAKLILAKADKPIVTYDIELGYNTTYNIPIEDIPMGVYRMAVLSNDGSYASERLFFAHPDRSINISISTDKESYSAREKTEVILKVNDSSGKLLEGNFSVAARYKSRSVTRNENRTSIASHILLQSDLKGSIPTPEFYFSKDPLATKALDLVMLTNGWRKIENKPIEDPEAIIGKVIDGRKNKKSSIEEFNLVSLKTSETKVLSLNDSGLFKVKSSEFKYWGDSIIVSINKLRKKEKTNVQFYDSTLIWKNSYLENLRKVKPVEVQQDIYSNKYKLAQDKFQESIFLDDVEVTAKRYTPRNGCELLERDPEEWTVRDRSTLDLSNPELITLLKQVSPLVKGSGDIMPIEVRPSTFVVKGKVFSMDRFKRSKISLDAILSTKIERQRFIVGYLEGREARVYYLNLAYQAPFEVYLNCQRITSYYQSLEDFNANKPNRKRFGALFYDITLDILDLSNVDFIAISDGSKYGARPLLMINTINRKLIRKESIKKFQVHVAYNNLSREFYQPAYNNQEKVDDIVPDLRNLVYWNPNVTTNEEGEAIISFYNADRPQIIEISVEGVASNGSPGIIRSEYQVKDEKVVLERK